MEKQRLVRYMRKDRKEAEWNDKHLYGYCDFFAVQNNQKKAARE